MKNSENCMKYSCPERINCIKQNSGCLKEQPCPGETCRLWNQCVKLGEGCIKNMRN